MASDITKWSDHALILSRHSNELLSALLFAKKTLDLETSPSNDILIRGGKPDITINFRGFVITPESPARPNMPRLGLFIDPGLASIQKQIIKKFPDTPDVKKELALIQNQPEEILKELKPYYDLFSAVAEYLEMCVPVLFAIQKFKLTIEHYPEMSILYMKTLVGLYKVLTLCSQIGPIKKVISFVYNKAYNLLNGENVSNWTSLVNLMKQDRPIVLLQATLSPVSNKIAAIMTGLEPFIKNQMVAEVSSLRKKSYLLAVPEVFGLEPDMKSIETPTFVFEAYIIGLFSIATSELFHGDFLIDVINWGYLIHLAGDETVSVHSESEAILKESNKLSKLKFSKQDLLNYVFKSHSLHHDRRQYIIQELRKFNGAISSKVNAPLLSRTIDILKAEKDELLLYFDHYDRDSNGNIKSTKKEPKILDHNTAELLYLIRHSWSLLEHNKNSIPFLILEILKQSFHNISDLYPIVVEEIGRILEEPDCLAEAEKQIIDTLLEGFKETPNETDFQGFRLSWLRFQLFTNINNKTSINRFPNLSEVMNTFQKDSVWVDMFDSMIAEQSSLKQLYWKQSAIHEHIKDILESGSNRNLKYPVGFCFIASDFNDIVTDIWPMEAENVNNHTMCYSTELFSIFGQYAAIIAHEICLHAILIQHTYKTENHSGNAKKKANKHAISEKLRPGIESRLQSIDAKILQIDEDRNRLRQLVQLLNCGGFSVEDVEFHPIEFFLDSLCSKFGAFLNEGIYLTGIVISKDNYGPGGSDDVMSFDIKRPSVFLSEIKSYLKASFFLNRITGINVTSLLRDVWMDQIDKKKARRCNAGFPGDLVFQMNHKIPREKGRAAQMDFIQPFLVTIVQWYTEFLGSKPRTGTTIYSPLHNSFSTIMNSTVTAEQYTDQTELNALCELIGLQGMQFLDEKLCRMIAMEVGLLREITNQNSKILEKMKLYDDSKLREANKRLIQPEDFILASITIGFICRFRETMYSAVERVFSAKYSDISNLVDNLMNLPNKGPIHQSVAVLANQIGKMDFNDGVLRWALSALTGIMILIVVENKDVLVWGLLPLMYANSTWNLCFYSSSKYLGQYDGMANNAHCLLYGFSKIMPLIINLIERDDSELHQAYKSLWKMASKFLVSGWITFSDPEFHSESARSLIISLHKLAHSTNVLSMDEVQEILPFSLLKMSLQPENQSISQKNAGIVSRDDDLAV